MIIIGGPTASGKTSLAAEVAKRLNGEIVSADSMQIYKGMDIGTAKVSDAELGVKQHLINIVEPYETFSVVDYRERAKKAVREIEKKGKLPVVAGGTGFYITSLLTEYGYGNEINAALKQQLQDELASCGAQSMHKKLKELDPLSAEKIHCNNTQRVMRALEVCIATGKPFSNQQNIKNNPISPYILFVLTVQNRNFLNERINNRVDVMINNGLEDEIKGLIAEKNLDFSMQSMQGIGYKEWKPRFDNTDIPVAAVADTIKKNTRAYAKRQQTWFAHQYQNAVFLDSNIEVESLADTIVETHNNFEYSKMNNNS